MDFRIPREKGHKFAGRKLSATVVQVYLENDKQMPYDKNLAKTGLYRQWIERKSDEELEAYLKANETEIGLGLQSRNLAPNFQEYEYLVYRNCLYKTELHLRHSVDTEDLDEELFGYHATWKSRFDVALMDWKKNQEEFQQEQEEKSGVNPFY